MNAGDAEVRGTTIEAIQQAVADMFGLPAEQLRQKSPRGVATGSFVDRRSWYLTDFGDRERGRSHAGSSGVAHRWQQPERIVPWQRNNIRKPSALRLV
jgi:hypothetical protein